MDPNIKTLGRYKIEGRLAASSSVTMFAAFDPQERQHVCLNVPHTPKASVRAIPDHPGWIRVLRTEQDAGETFTVTDGIQGKPLDSSLPPGEKLLARDAVSILKQLAAALDYAHARGLTHGTFHPAGVILTEVGQTKIFDFGGDAPPDELLRALDYLSPERLRDSDVDGRSDQFSLAVLACRMLTGKFPFPSDSSIGVIYRLSFGVLESTALDELRPDARAALRRALAKDPGQRYRSCTELVTALDRGLVERKAAPPTREVESEKVAVRPGGALASPRISPEPWRSALFSDSPPKSGWFGQRESVKYFVVTFTICVVVLGVLLFIFLPRPSGAKTSLTPVKVEPAAVKSLPKALPAASGTAVPAPNRPPAQVKPAAVTPRRVPKPPPKEEPVVVPPPPPEPPPEPEQVLKLAEPKVRQ